MTSSSDYPDLLADLPSASTESGRRRFLDALNADLHIAMAQGERLAIVLVDLRKFLGFNLAHGYDLGDEVLLEVPALLKAAIRKASTVERLGDNCFGLVIPALSSSALLPLAAEKIRRTLNETRECGTQRVSLECHIASAVYPDEGQLGQDLLLNAERMLVDVKAKKFNDIAIPVLLHSSARERWTMEKLLREAVDRGELELYYQPKIKLRDRTVASAEALMRWNSEELGFVRPDQFITIAEESSLINHITEWALKTAIRERSELTGAGEAFAVAVNLSASDIYDSGIVQSLASILAIWGVNPEHLTVEVTESVIMDNPDLALNNLQQIRDLGIRVALDDFGTGYSSLAYFKSLPLDEIKIDKSFIQTMLEDGDDAILVEAIISLAHKFNLSVVAEGVEDADTLLRLSAMGCDYVQGFHFSRPLPREQFVDWIAHFDPDRYWRSNPPS